MCSEFWDFCQIGSSCWNDLEIQQHNTELGRLRLRTVDRPINHRVFCFIILHSKVLKWSWDYLDKKTLSKNIQTNAFIRLVLPSWTTGKSEPSATTNMALGGQFGWEWPHMLESLVPSRWNYLGRFRGTALREEVCHWWGRALRIPKTHPITS